MKAQLLFTLLLITSFVFTGNTYAQSLSAAGQNASNKLTNEHFPRLKKMKSEIESQRSTIASKKCDEYIDAVNKAVGVWNTVPKSDIGNSKLKPVKKELDEYIAFAKESQIIYKERQAAEKENTAVANTTSNNNVKTINSNFKVGDKVSVVSSSEWSWGTITGLAGKEFQPKAGIANQDIEIDVQKKLSYLPLGKQIVGEKTVFEYWPYHDFFADIKALNLNQFYRMLFESGGNNVAPGYGVFTPNGVNLLQLQKEIKAVEDILKKYPPLPADAQRYADRSARDVNASAYKTAIDNKAVFLKKKIDERINEHLKLIYEGDFSPVSISTNQQFKYIDGKMETMFWRDIVCGNPDRIKKAIVKDLNDFLTEMQMPANGETYLVDWDKMIEAKKAKYTQEANKDRNWATEYPFSDAGAMTLYKRDIGGSPIKIVFNSSTPKVSGGIQDKDKRKYGIAFFAKEAGCPYHFYVEFYILETHKGGGAYDAPRCIYGGTGYTNKTP